MDWDAWFHAPGMPPVNNSFDTTLSAAASSLAERWQSVTQSDLATASFSSADISSFNARQTQAFLDALLVGPTLPAATLDAIDCCYEFSASKNAEIRFRWQVWGFPSFETCFAQVLVAASWTED